MSVPPRLCLPVLLALVLTYTTTIADSTNRDIAIMNESGHRVEVNWINPDTGELSLQSTPHIFNGATLNLKSYVSHRFEVRELPGKKSGECGDKDSGDKSCRVNYFAVTDQEDQVYKIKKNFLIDEIDNLSLAQDEARASTENCQERALKMIRRADMTKDIAVDAISLLMDCVEESVTEKIIKADEEVRFQAGIRTDMGMRLENYTCADPQMNTSEPVETKNWYNRGASRKALTMHERENSKIMLVKNFILPEECEAMETSAKHTLRRASVAAQDGGSEFSASRKAMQAGIRVPWHEKDHPIAVLSRRVYDFTNYATGFDINEKGQEDLMSIQYEGRGEDDEEPDRYTPHCDGDCTGLPHKTGTRFATMVMYCKLPEKGGSTNFRNSAVHVKPEAGDAVFFSYMGPDKIMDKGFTEHSGCPVYEGEKKIVTQWMRMGVDEDNTWDSFNSMGVKHSDAMND